GEPHVPSIYRILRCPTVGHKNESSLLTLNGKYKGALGIECQISVFSNRRIAQRLPWTQHIIRHKRPGSIGIPTCTSGSNHIVSPFMLEDGRSFIVSCRLHNSPFSGEIQVIVRQLRDV